MQNPSCVLYGAGDARYEDRPVPVIRDPHDVIVQIGYVGVCGSDVHFWSNGAIGTKIIDHKNALVMGHEASGTVHAVGEAVLELKVGDKVAIEPGFPCRRCKTCKDGRYNLCRNVKFAASPAPEHGLTGTDGMLSKFVLVPADFCYRIADNIGLDEAVLVEPLAVAAHVVRLADVRPGDKVVVMGSGTIGLLCAAVAKVFGAGDVVIVDILEKKLQFAQKFLQCKIFTPNTRASSVDNAAVMVEKFSLGEGADVVLEASGAETSVQTGIHVLRPGGTYVQAGLGKAEQSIPILRLSEKELRVMGCFRYGSGDFSLALSMIEKGQVSVKSLITSVVTFEEAPEAWERTRKGEGIKNLIAGS